ncbi:MAG: STAS domain-containing protein [Desulfovibrionaceae bacterium]|nr:STAS domain-containing protein [Desulfovibrionaceae bacterium]
MRQPGRTVLAENLSKVLIVEPVDPYMGPRFPCRPLVAHSAEWHTTFGMFSGQIGLSAVPEFTAAMHDLFTENLSKVILDFAQLSLTKSAVGALVAFAAAMHGRNRRLYLYRASAQILGVLKELKLTPYFTFLAAEDDIIATLVA